MKQNNYLHIILIIAAGFFYSNLGSYAALIVSGIALSTIVAKGDIRSALFASALTLVIICVAKNGGYSLAVSFLLAGVLPGFGIGQSFRKKSPLESAVVFPFLCFVGDWAYRFFSHKAITGTNMFEDITKAFEKELDPVLKDAAAAAGIAADDKAVETLRDVFSAALSLINIIMPAIIIIISAFSAFLIIMLTRRISFKNAQTGITPFCKIYAPGSLSTVTTLSTAACIFIRDESTQYFFANIVIVLLAFFLLCGVSVLDFFFRKKVPGFAPRAVIYFAAFIIFSMLPQILYTALFILGMADGVFDFRKIRKTPSHNAE